MYCKHGANRSPANSQSSPRLPGWDPSTEAFLTTCSPILAWQLVQACSILVSSCSHKIIAPWIVGCHPPSLAALSVFDSQECCGRGAGGCPLNRTQDSRGSLYSFPLSRNLIRLQIPLLYASTWSRVCGLRCTQIGRQRRSTEREDYDKRRAQTNAALATGLSELAQLAFRGLCRRVPTGFPREGHSQKCRQPPSRKPGHDVKKTCDCNAANSSGIWEGSFSIVRNCPGLPWG